MILETYVEDARTVPADPIRHFVGEDPWLTVWQYRFPPAAMLEAVSPEWDHGLDHLIYFRALAND